MKRPNDVELNWKHGEPYIVDKTDKGIYKIYLEDIIYIETYKRNTLIHTKKENILSYKTMKYHLKILNNSFYRCHESYIVNFKYISKIIKLDITLKNNEILPLSKNRKIGFLEALLNFYRSQLLSNN
ncbi:MULTISPECIES: LytTR family DNA-binding domain-containing protein [Clostridium]|uniref:LytTR family transcriptional regulator n=1 Tax=Clostridium cibarium TaxID=2762247 RepID=A0ABR8PR52_9CLOT|nr:MULTISPECIES: LytTR family DNA-binding domain-containing protein [Clostridium]MBD7910632.1 LytTR family transcriptional regulator [Clostridium cibarium]